MGTLRRFFVRVVSGCEALVILILMTLFGGDPGPTEDK